MDVKIINQVSSQVYRKFPEVRGCYPEIHDQGDRTLFIYSGSVVASDGKSMRRIVRVVVNPQGKVVKMTTSR